MIVKKQKISMVILIILVMCVTLMPVTASAYTKSYNCKIMQHQTKTYTFVTANTLKSKKITFKPKTGTVREALIGGSWKSMKMMYSVTIYNSKNKVVGTFTWNPNAARIGESHSWKLSKNAKYTVMVTGLGCYGNSILEEYKSTDNMPKMNISTKNCKVK